MNMPHANALPMIVLSNLLPLAGVLFAGWDVFTLLVFYWCETLIIGFWTVVTMALFKGEVTWSMDGPTHPASPSAAGAATMIAFHAGFFMAIHFFMMAQLYGEGWPGATRSVTAFVETFLIGQKLWPMLALVFLHRAAIFFEERKQTSLLPTVAGLYTRIVVMQVVIVIGAWGVMLTGSGLFGLILLIAMRVALDLYWPRLITYVVNTMMKSKKK